MPKRSIGIGNRAEENERENEKSDGNVLITNKDISITNDESDLSDSEESVYSGLEEEDSSGGSSGDDEGDDESEEHSENENEEDDEKEDELDDLSNDEHQVSIDEFNEEPNQNIDKLITDNEEKKSYVKTSAVFEEADTSDEEDIRNTVGNIPIEWYNEYPHIGYTREGEKIVKPAKGDELDAFLSKMDDPDYWKTVYDKTNMENVILTDEELGIIQKIQAGVYPGHESDPYEPYVDWFTGEKMIHPISEAPATKSSFIPSKWEHKRIMKIVRAIRNGWIKPKATKDDKKQFFLLWNQLDQSKEKHPMHWPAPKIKLPGHEESYNPPPEYLPTGEEEAAWAEMDPDDRPKNFLPKKYDCLRRVPAYSNFMQERFERCLDLYLCPRQRKVRLQVNPEDLIPKLPRPKDLQPFPTTETLIYRGHTAAVHCISINHSGQWLASGGGDETIRFWEISTGRCMKTIPTHGSVHSIKWNPNSNLCIVAVAVDNTLHLINPHLGDKLISTNTDNTVNSWLSEVQDPDKNLAKWSSSSSKDYQEGFRIQIIHEKAIKQITWHNKGDYMAVVMPEGGSKSVLIHQLSKQRSQCPFKREKGLVQNIQFHPTRPFFFVATQRYIRIYNLQKQILTKKLLAGVKWISSMAIHPQGDNLIIGSYDKRLCWFDMDLSSKPYKMLRHHKQAIRQVAFHKSYPLFASASDDGALIICHGKVYRDLMQNPLIVPVKIIRGHATVNNLGITDCEFHPTQPWIITAGADHTIRLFT